MKERAMEEDPFGRTTNGGGVHSTPENTSQSEQHAGNICLILSIMLPTLSCWCLSLTNAIHQGSQLMVCLEVSFLQSKAEQRTAEDGTDIRRGHICRKQPAQVIRLSKTSFGIIALFFIPNGQLSITK